MDTCFKNGLTDLDNVIFVCFGLPDDMDVYEAGEREGVVIDLIAHIHARASRDIQIELRHQYDSSYDEGA